MADFCWDCCRDVLGVPPEKNDLKGIVKEGEYLETLCEGCGWITVDHNGRKLQETDDDEEG